MAREEAKIQRKREQNEQRRLRILNAKARIMGLDVQSLDQQVMEKEQQKQREKEADRFESKKTLEADIIFDLTLLLCHLRNPSNGN